MAEEEHRCQAPRLCANNCGFFGSPATQNLCSKCYRDLQLKEHHELALSQTLASASSSSSSSSSSGSQITTSYSVSSPVLHAPPPAVDTKEEEEEEVEVSERVGKIAETAARPNRCLTCMRRVGLTGFRCRCGMTFCGTHRYPEQHGCGFDFKGMGKDQIAKANPVVKADKLHKI
ncbi:Zinc finger transcription factor [Parasponia andersonii]|uniref:Zinc finger transcription factor n=1 Tax=Parasponia andersonii TaxID=3476 RepID=A0A2P5DU52_PARAD|nr:Zinc finger transcription factor [Parasponia andersonii]